MVAVAPKPAKAPQTKPRRMTPEEFLEWEYHHEGRYEYVEGEIIPIAGESREHNRIAGNIHTEINLAIRQQPCSVYIEGIRVRVANRKFRYPDVIALCGEEQVENTRPETLLNPQVIIEVLSSSTRSIELVDKVAEYLELPSVTDYLIFEQTQMQAYHYRPTGSLPHTAQIYTAPDSAIRLEALDVTLKLADLYFKVALPTPEAGDDEAQTDEDETESETDDAAL